MATERLSVDLQKRLDKVCMTQTSLSKVLGVTASTVSFWCKNKTVPHYRRKAVSAALADASLKLKPKTIIRRGATKPSVERIGSVEVTKDSATSAKSEEGVKREEVVKREQSYSKIELTFAYNNGYEEALKIIKGLLTVPTDDSTKLSMIQDFQLRFNEAR